MEESNLNIPLVEPAALFDANKYNGRKVKIEKVERIRRKNFYPDGTNFDPESTLTVPGVKITTEVLETITKKDGTKIPITVNQEFSLQEREKEDGTKEVVISKNPNTKIWKLMRALGADTLDELKGKLVKLTAVPDKDPASDRLYLKIVI